MYLGRDQVRDLGRPGNVCELLLPRLPAIDRRSDGVRDHRTEISVSIYQRRAQVPFSTRRQWKRDEPRLLRFLRRADCDENCGDAGRDGYKGGKAGRTWALQTHDEPLHV